MAIALKDKLTPLLEDVSRPISGDDPVGEDISYDDDFQALKDVIDQISSVNPEGVDYDYIAATSQRLLGQKSKDLRVSTYLALALAKTQGYRGLLEGLLAQKLMMEGFWEVMYPPLRRMRARQGALQFMAERLTQETQTMTPELDDKEAIAGALDVLKDVQGFTMEAMGEDAPMLSGLRKALEDAQRNVPQPQAPSKPVEAPKLAAAPSPAPVQSVAAPASVAEPQSADEALGQLMNLASFLRQQDQTHPTAYRLARSVQWDVIRDEPPNEQGMTMMEDLAEHRMVYLNNLVQEADWATLLQVAEDTFYEVPYHFLLDLQRFVTTAMEGLGTAYQGAKEAVLLETALLIKRVPGLTRFTFIEGMPFVDPATQFWLEQAVAPVLASGGGGEASGDDKVLVDQYDEAKKLFSEGKLAEALGILQDGAKQDGSPRSRFQRRYYMALLCLQGNQPLIACSMLEGLDQEIEQYALDHWEPHRALEVWTQLHRCYSLLKGKEEIAQEGLADRARRVLAKISQIDVTHALKATGVS